MSAKRLFEGEGLATDDTSVVYVVVLGFVGTLTGLIVSLATDRAGPWWAWVLGIVASIALGARSFTSSSMRLEITESSGVRRLRVSGRGGSIDGEIDGGIEHWHYTEAVPLRQGGGVMAHFTLVLTMKDGRRVTFRQMGGRDGAGWPAKSAAVPDGPDVFVVTDIFGLQRALTATA